MSESDDFDPTQGYVSDEEREALRVEQANLEAEKRAREAMQFWQQDVFANEAGRREMFKLLAELGTFNTPFAVGPTGFPQSEATWFRFGAQHFGLGLFLKWLKANPPGVLQMYLEGTN